MTIPRRQDADIPRAESTAERVDRNLTELLSELRVALPGVQVLFAFLLVVPFNQRFGAADALARTTYFVTLLLAAAASIFLIAPSFHHRLLFRRRRKERVVLTGNALALVGLVLLALAMTGVVLMVTEFLFGPFVGGLASAAVACLFGTVWFGIAAAGLRGRSGTSDLIRGRDEPNEPSPRMPTEEA
jgi:amino acid transporter